ncbi:hypothetical protein [Anaeromicropila populeti]|uniref:Uncharacterized protein n=1 Tax=Anaeromicropila populeti TaxID=37658 RepID=A0A1I6KCJ7_9FIRM|nr:hypothetical protein [Anaeromicropila populeti]SFR88758.1 hypothetical protein SAMN05661086_02358 [Anaeromicropila populeti]
MSEQVNHIKEYRGYEYKDILVDKDKVGFYLDSYENFGWTVDERFMSRALQTANAKGKIQLKLRRERGLINRVELTRLQRHFEDSIAQMERLERSKTATATMAALTTGLIGTAFMAGSVFAVIHEPPLILLCIMFAIPGFLGWILPNFLYKNLVFKRNEEINPLIQQKRDELYEICGKGHKLLTN